MSQTFSADFLSDLNDAQRAAATAGDGPLLIIAGAGTGKTKTLAARVAHLLGAGVSPDRILLLTFTRRAAHEMLTRATRMIESAAVAGRGGVSPAATGRLVAGTFHAVANRLLRTHAQSLGLSPAFTVLDQSDAADLLHLIRTDHLSARESSSGAKTAQKTRRFPQKGTLAAVYSYMVNARVKLSDVLATRFPWCGDDGDAIKAIFSEYTRRKRAQNVLDYDDLLLYWKALLATPVVGEHVADSFDHVLVDEYQDTNLVQAEILQLLRGRNKNITVVGDDAQSIYSFRAATVRNILDFPAQFPGARVVTLEQNYRSTQPILDASNAVMAQAAERYTKNLFSARASAVKPSLVTCVDEQEQCDEVCSRVLAALEQRMPLKRQAVLFRAAHHSDALEIELTRRNIPFVKFGGLKFIESAHIKDLLALLRLLDNPADELAWFRTLLLLDGVGPATADRILQAMGLRPAKSPTLGFVAPAGANDSAATLLGRAASLVPAPAQQDFSSLLGALGDCLGASLGPAATIERLRRFYAPAFERLYDNPGPRLRDLDQLEQIAGNYRSTTQFITDLTLDPPTNTQDLAGPPLLDDDYLILSTIHSAKGMEWDHVHILHAADGMIPSDMATGSQPEIDEERRLFYVAMTRAKSALHVYFPLRYHHKTGPGAGRRSDRHSFAQLTRFLPGEAQKHFERQPAPRARFSDSPVPAGATPAARPTAPAAVDSFLNDLLS